MGGEEIVAIATMLDCLGKVFRQISAWCANVFILRVVSVAGKDHLTMVEQVFDTRQLMVSPKLAALPADVLAKIAPISLAGDQLLPLSPALAAIVPWAGLRRGTSVSVQSKRGIPGLGATSLSLALVAEATSQGSWAAIVGVPSCGLGAAVELGVAPERLAVIDQPEPAVWPAVVGALLGSFDLVVVAPPTRLRPADQRRLLSRARERGTVVVSSGADPIGTTDLGFTITRARWRGLGEGHGHLRSRDIELRVEGRREASRPRTVYLRLPGASGEVELIDDLEPIDLRDAGQTTPVSQNDVVSLPVRRRRAGKSKNRGTA